MKNFDIIVVGSGHAGVEAALACSRLGVKTLMITMSADQIGTMSCNPAVGGLGKSQLVKEIDILGGQMARAADQTALQYRILNAAKGPSVRATRVHVDRHEYREKMKWTVENSPNLQLRQGMVTKLLLESGKIVGVETHLGEKISCRAVVVTTGTFMNGKAHIGKINFSSGRAGEPASFGLSDFLASLGIRVRRFKTGTVPRIDHRSIDFSETQEQKSEICAPFSAFTKELRKDLESAHLTFTNKRTHEVIAKSLDQSPLYSGIIESRGPRYCPSLEDKVVRFADKDRHQIFLEKEGRYTNEVYVGGMSTSLPVSCQVEFLRTIPALRNAEIIRPGYAIEYDFIDSTQLKHSLEFKEIENLFMAGQVNGTSGYEEAAAQGLIAGINAAHKILEREAFVLSRSESYIGVLIDDLTSKGTTEPYRMLSSRAEWRLLLREDNVQERLFLKSASAGLLSEADRTLIESSMERRQSLRKLLESGRLSPSLELNQLLESLEYPALTTKVFAKEFFKRPKVDEKNAARFFDFADAFNDEDWRQVVTEFKYEGYLKQAESQLRQVQRMERVLLPVNLSFKKIQGLPIEAVEKLEKFRPRTLADASRIEGVTPASLSILAIYLSKSPNQLAAHQ